MSLEAVNLDMVPTNCPAVRAWKVRKEVLRKQLSSCEVPGSDHRIEVEEIEPVRTAAELIGCALLPKLLPSAETPVPQFGTDEWKAFVGACPAYIKAKELQRENR